jgi:CHAT domain-containing protein
VLVLDTGEMKPVAEETFVWVITKSDARWLRSELGRPMLAREVAALRCGLDFTAWTGAGAQRCAQGLGLPAGLVPRADEQLPYDVDRAHRIYRALLGEAGDLIAGRHLLVVAPGALAQLPLQALVTAPFSGGDLRAVGWLARQNALTVLPAVSSLKALRRHARPSAAQLPMIGFGNPLLDGMDARMAGAAKLARELQHCTQALRQREAATQSERRLRALRTGLADSRQLKTQSPLPETAYELCTVARQLRADLGEIRLGMRASEREIKALSGSGRLAQYRVVHFATHGTLAGEIAGSSEPGLILTPPVAASGDDDGYLSASEIAGLKLDADWVILSACNTAAGGATGAEALSGLARAFFFAQARALLVSHWNVYSDTTVKLVTHTMGTLAREPALGRAEALRRAMVAMIDTGEPREAHPAYWAPFVVVGEGAGETASSATARRAR